MKITAISDLHGHFPVLSGGDLLIIAGDLTARHSTTEFFAFLAWLKKQKYRKKVLVAGNHDEVLDKGIPFSMLDEFEQTCTYLLDSVTEFEGLKIWGSPWTMKFLGQNPDYMAFSCDIDTQMMEKWEMIPDDVDILITHTPPYGILDECSRGRFGCKHLYNKLYSEKIKPRLHVFGHIHESHGHIPKMLDMPRTQFVNAAIMNEVYEPVNKPIRIVL